MKPVHGVALLALGVLVSRILGFLRDALFASLLGAGADAFLVAFRIPNFFKRLLAEGSLGMAHGSVVSKYAAQQGAAAARALSCSVAASVFLVALPATALVALLAKPFVFFLAPGFSLHPEFFASASVFVRQTLPYIPLSLVSAVALAHHASMGNMVPQAWSSALLNAVMIAAGVLALMLPVATVEQFYGGAAGMLCVGILVGGCLQALPAVALFWRKGKGFLRISLFQKDVLAVLRGMPGSVAGAASHQIHALCGMVLASFLATGSITKLYLAERLFEVPLGLAGATIGIAVLPGLSRHAARKDATSFSSTLSRGLSLGAFLSLPATAGLVGLAPTLVALLFGHGVFAAEDVAQTAHVLRVYALGVPAICAARPLLAALHALGEQKKIFRAVVWSLVPVFLAGGAGFLAEKYCAVQGTLFVAAGIAVGAWCYTVFLLRQVVHHEVANPLHLISRTLWEYAAGAVILGGCVLFIALPAEASWYVAGKVLGIVFASMLGWGAVFYARKNNDMRHLLAVLPEKLLRKSRKSRGFPEKK